MRRITSILLVLALLISFPLTALAATPSKTSNSVFFLDAGDGRYLNIGSTDTATTRSSQLIEAFPTETDGIYLISDSLYLVETTQRFFTLSEKVNLNSRNNSSNQVIYNSYGISERLQKDIAENIARERDNGNLEFSINLYVPANNSARSSQETTYTTENGYTCKDYIVTYNNCRTDPVDKNGATAKTHADSFFNFVISAVGCVSTTVALFGAGKSAFDLFVDLHGSVSSGTQSDLTYSLLVYDKKTKDTYYLNPYVNEWEEGCFSQYVSMKRNDTYQYYASNGESELIKTTLTKTYWTEHYYDPEFAVYSAPICFIDGYIFVDLYGETIRL